MPTKSVRYYIIKQASVLKSSALQVLTFKFAKFIKSSKTVAINSIGQMASEGKI